MAIIEGFICGCKKAFKRWFHNRRYTYGHAMNPDGSIHCPARLDKKDGRAYFVLWKAGEQGHKTDYWHVMGYGWEKSFQPIE